MNDELNGSSNGITHGMEAEVMPRLKADRLRELENQERNFHGGYSIMVKALTTIKDRRLFEEAGYKTFTPYCKERLHIDSGSLSRLLYAMPILARLGELEISSSTELGSIRPVHLRAVEGMRPADAAQAIARAIKTAPLGRFGKPRLTRKRIEYEARKTGFVPRKEYIAARSSLRHVAKSSKPIEKPDAYAQFVEALHLIVTLGKSSGDFWAEDTDGNVFAFENFADARDYIVDLQQRSVDAGFREPER